MVCRNQREVLGELLEDLVEALRAAGMLKSKAKIIDAKVPIIKCTLNYGKHLTSPPLRAVPPPPPLLDPLSPPSLFLSPT